jgi:hypothetical protein
LGKVSGMTATTEPSRVTAGDTVAWLKSLAEYPASASWVLSYTLINSTAKITITATASGVNHAVSVPAATTAAWGAGTYTWMAVVTKAAERYTVGQGSLVIAPNLAAQTTFDTRSSAKKALEAVNALLESYGSKAYLQGYEINGRRQQFQSPGDFLAFRDKLKAEVAREDNAARLAAGLSGKNQLFVRFNSR